MELMAVLVFYLLFDDRIKQIVYALCKCEKCMKELHEDDTPEA